MITYTSDQIERLRQNPMAEVDAEHDAIMELLIAPPTKDQDITRCLRSRTRWRRLDAIREQGEVFPIADRVADTGGMDDPSFVAERTEERDLVAIALGKLQEGDRDVLHARYFRGLRLQDVAAKLGCTLQSVHSREKKAIQKLRQFLSPIREV